MGAYVLPYARCDSILLGGLLALLISDARAGEAVRMHRRALIGVFLVLLLGAGVITVRNPAIGDPFNHFWLALLYCTFVLLALHPEGILGWVLRGRVLGWFGTRSYAIYLFHQPVSGLIHQRMGTLPPSFHDIPSSLPTLLAFGVVLVLAELSFRFFEAPFLRLGQRFQYGPPSPSAGASVS